MGLAQLLFQFRQRHIGLSGYCGPQILLNIRVQLSRWPMAQLARPLRQPAPQLLAADLLGVSITDAKLARQFFQAPSPSGIGSQQLQTQVV
jgi:hypothetical protein